MKGTVNKFGNFTKLVLRKFFKVNLDEIATTLANSQSELENCRNSVKLLTEEKKELEQKASNLSDNLKSTKVNLVATRRENETLKSKNDVLLGNFTVLDKKKLQLQQQNSILHKEIDNLKTERNKLYKDLAEKDERSKSYISAVEALKNEKQIIADERTDLLAKSKELQKKLDETIAELEMTKDAANRVSNEIIKHQEEKDALEIQLKNVSFLEEEWVKLKGNNTNLSVQKKELQDNLDKVNSELSKVKMELAHANSIIDEKDQNLSTLNDEKKENEKLKEDINRLKKELRDLELSKSNQDNNLSATDDLNKLARELDAKERTIQTLTEEKANNNNRIAELEDELNELRKSYDEDMAKLNNLLQAKISTIYGLEDKIKSLENELAKQVVNDVKDVVHENNTENAELVEEITQDVSLNDNVAGQKNKKQAKVHATIDNQPDSSDNEDIPIDLPDIVNDASVETVRSIKKVLNTQTGEVISADDFFRQAPESIAIISRRLEIISRFGGDPLFVCAKCMNPVKVSKISKRKGETLFFCHCKHNVNCDWKTPTYVAAASVDDTKLEEDDLKSISHELVRYIQLKQLIIKTLKKQKHTGDDIEDIEEDIKITAPNNNRRWRKYDIAMRWHGKKVVFKLQRSRDYLQDLVTHDQFAKDNDYHIIWIFGSDSKSRYDYIKEHNYQNTLFDNKSCVFILDREAEKECEHTGKLHIKCNWLVDGKHWYYTLENSGTNGKLVTLDDLIFNEDNFKPFYKEGFDPNLQLEDDMIELKPGVFSYRIDSLWGIINTNLNIRSECKYSSIELDADGRIKAITADYPRQRTGYLSDEGEELPTRKEPLNNHIYMICTFEQWYLAMDTGQRLSENYDHLMKWNDTRAVFMQNNKYGILDYNGEIIKEAKFKSFVIDDEVKATVADSLGSYHIDVNGNIIAEDSIELKDGFQKVKHLGKWGLKLNGKLIVDYIYDEIGSFRCRFYGFNGKDFIKLANQPRYNYRVPFKAKYVKLSSVNYEFLINGTTLFLPAKQLQDITFDRNKDYSLVISNISKRNDASDKVVVGLANPKSLNKPFVHVDLDSDFKIGEKLKGEITKVNSQNGRRYVSFEDGRQTYIPKGQFTESEVDKNNYIKGSQIVLKKIGFEDFYERTIWKVIE